MVNAVKMEIEKIVLVRVTNVVITTVVVLVLVLVVLMAGDDASDSWVEEER